MNHALACRQRCTRCGMVAAATILLIVSGVAQATAQEVYPLQPVNHVLGGQEPVPAPVPDPALLPGATLPSGNASDCTDCYPVFTDGGCGPYGGCVSGRSPCHSCTAKTRIGRFTCAMYHSLCCPDPCYDPVWVGVKNAAFFVDSARPNTHQRVRWDAGRNMIFPDRAEFFWAQADGGGLGPSAPQLRRLDYNDLSLYTETAGGTSFAFFVEMPYREVRPDGTTPHAAGFADMNLGTKSVMFDTELLQVTFQFRTFIPQANSSKGLGTGHVSLEPSLLVGLNLGPNTFLQGQLSEWIPISADDYAGSILHHHLSFNQVLYRALPDVPLIGTLEYNGWSFQSGYYTDPDLGMQPASGYTYVSAGPGLRLVVCDKVDFGMGVAFALTSDHFAKYLYRSEFRWRF